MRCHFILTALVCLVLFTHSSYAGVTLNGTKYHSLQEVASKLNLKFKWESPNQEAVLSNSQVQLVFNKGKRYVLINNVQTWLGHAPRVHKNKFYITDLDISNLIAPILLPHKYPSPPKLYHIVIDPGHGGKDHGTSNADFNLKEKDLTLDLSLRLKKELERAGYKVSLTRKDDRFVSLKERPSFANRKKADLFVSIHFNAVASGKNSVKGIETYAFTLKNHPSTSGSAVTAADRQSFPANQFDSWNALLGYSIHRSTFQNTNSVDRGLKRARFAVLKSLNCPGVLVEAGFLSHPQECQQIKSPAHRQKLAKSIAQGIFNYQKTLNYIRKKSPRA